MNGDGGSLPWTPLGPPRGHPRLPARPSPRPPTPALPPPGECFQWVPDAKARAGLPGWEAARREHLGEELADCLLYLVRLSAACGVDLAAAALRKLEKNGAKYPADVVRGSERKYTEYGGRGAGGAGGAAGAATGV